MDRVYTTRSVSLLERANSHTERNGNVIGAGAARMHGRGVEGDHDSNQTKLVKVTERTSVGQCLLHAFSSTSSSASITRLTTPLHKHSIPCLVLNLTSSDQRQLPSHSPRPSDHE